MVFRNFIIVAAFKKIMDFPISGQELVQLIPQKEPFVFISSLLSVDERRCTTTFTFDPNHACATMAT
jgi:hypothetical protein